MEHFEDGPEPILQEAYRVLKDDGYLLVSVPRMHALRRLKALLGFYSKTVGGDFYQYAFGNEEFRNILKKMGFSVEDKYFYDPVKGIKDEIAVFNYFYKRNQIPSGFIRWMRASKLLNRLASHMMLFVATKVVSAG